MQFVVGDRQTSLVTPGSGQTDDAMPITLTEAENISQHSILSPSSRNSTSFVQDKVSFNNDEDEAESESESVVEDDSDERNVAMNEEEEEEEVEEEEFDNQEEAEVQEEGNNAIPQKNNLQLDLIEEEDEENISAYVSKVYNRTIVGHFKSFVGFYEYIFVKSNQSAAETARKINKTFGNHSVNERTVQL